jgi:hypothetical protein
VFEAYDVLPRDLHATVEEIYEKHQSRYVASGPRFHFGPAEDVYCIQLFRDGAWWRAFVNTEIIFPVP